MYDKSCFELLLGLALEVQVRFLFSSESKSYEQHILSCVGERERWLDPKRGLTQRRVKVVVQKRAWLLGTLTTRE